MSTGVHASPQASRAVGSPIGSRNRRPANPNPAWGAFPDWEQRPAGKRGELNHPVGDLDEERIYEFPAGRSLSQHGPEAAQEVTRTQTRSMGDASGYLQGVEGGSAHVDITAPGRHTATLTRSRR
jgi:hypothetical protein